MLKVKQYDSANDLVTIECLCGEVFSYDIKSVVELKFLEEFGQYENVSIACPHCNMIHFLNTNIPEDDYSEVELEEMVMPHDDINNRKVLRDIMWAKRKDLKGKDRAEYNKQFKYLLDEWKSKKQELTSRQMNTNFQ